MTNVKRTYFITNEEAEALHPYIDPTMPQYELEDGTALYAYMQWVDTYSGHMYRTLDELIELKTNHDKLRNA